jgi:hypothetical protein
MTTATPRLPACSVPLPDNVVRLPVRPAAGPMGALITLARYRAAWLRANPNATADEELAAAAEIAKELGL